MPYIKDDRRAVLVNDIERITRRLEAMSWSEGDVTYVFYKILLAWWNHRRSYNTISHIRGTLIGLISEFDRQEAHPYEDEKIAENGDILIS